MRQIAALYSDIIMVLVPIAMMYLLIFQGARGVVPWVCFGATVIYWTTRRWRM